MTLGFEGLRDDITKILAGEEINVHTGTFRNDLNDINSKDEVLTALTHLGYLGFRKISDDYGVVYVPNHEVRQTFLSSIS